MLLRMNTDFLPSIQSFAEPWLLFLADDPVLRMLQLGMLLLGCFVIFLVFYTTRDILLRTHSFFYMFVSIVLVALLPVLGFFLYLLIRPARTLRERELYDMVARLQRAPQKKAGRKVAKTPEKA